MMLCPIPNDFSLNPFRKNIDYSLPRESFFWIIIHFTFSYYISFQMPVTPLTPTQHNILQGSEVNHNATDGGTERDEVDRRNEVS